MSRKSLILSCAAVLAVASFCPMASMAADQQKQTHDKSAAQLIRELRDEASRLGVTLTNISVNENIVTSATHGESAHQANTCTVSVTSSGQHEVSVTADTCAEANEAIGKAID